MSRQSIEYSIKKSPRERRTIASGRMSQRKRYRRSGVHVPIDAQATHSAARSSCIHVRLVAIIFGRSGVDPANDSAQKALIRLWSDKRRRSMRKFALIAAALLIGSAGSALAQKGMSGSNGMGGARGASEFSPGDQMRDAGGPRKTVRGASEFSPGDRMRDAGGPKKTTRGASEFTPGDQMNDRRHR